MKNSIAQQRPQMNLVFPELDLSRFIIYHDSEPHERTVNRRIKLDQTFIRTFIHLLQLRTYRGIANFSRRIYFYRRCIQMSFFEGRIRLACVYGNKRRVNISENPTARIAVMHFSLIPGEGTLGPVALFNFLAFMA